MLLTICAVCVLTGVTTASEEDFDKCNLPAAFNPPEQNHCLDPHQEERYYFNMKAGICTRFLYYGCPANANNFKNELECRESCQKHLRDGRPLCSLPEDVGTPPALYISSSTRSRRYRFNQNTCKCESFSYEGAGGNINNFKTQSSCEASCGCTGQDTGAECACSKPLSVCDQPPVVEGSCEAAIPSFYWDKDTCRCEPFTYSGCRGNGNRFEGREQCENSCRDSCDYSLVCLKAPETTYSPAAHAEPRYFFSLAECQCLVFKYYGTGGNANIFQTELQCKERCSAVSKDLCPNLGDPVDIHK